MSIKKNNQTVLNDVINVPLTQSIINSPTTDNVIPSGKAVFDAIHRSISMTLNSTSDIITLLNTLRALASGTNATIKLYDGSGVLFPVAGNYIGTISVINGNEIIVICVNHWDSHHAYTFRIQSEDTSISVNKICTTKVADIPLTSVTIPEGLFQTVNNSSYIKYEVVNGIAFIYFCIRDAKIVSSGKAANLIVPKLKNPFNHIIVGESLNSSITILASGNNMNIWTLGDETVSTHYSACISYPVAES